MDRRCSCAAVDPGEGIGLQRGTCCCRTQGVQCAWVPAGYPRCIGSGYMQTHCDSEMCWSRVRRCGQGRGKNAGLTAVVVSAMERAAGTPEREDESMFVQVQG